MNARKQIESALEDAGVELHEVKWFWSGDAGKGWYYRTNHDAPWSFLGHNTKMALAEIAGMPNPNRIERPKLTGRVSVDSHPELYREAEQEAAKLDDFGNPVVSPFGHR